MQRHSCAAVAGCILLLFLVQHMQCLADVRPCAVLHSVTSGQYSFSVQVNFYNVRAYRCVMKIPIAYLPANGTRYGPLAAARCLDDGLGCIKLLEPVNVTVDSDIPTYERQFTPETIRSQFDPIGQSVPFVTAGAHVVDMQFYGDLPYADWVPLLTGFESRTANPKGARALAEMRSNFVISTFTNQSPVETGADDSIFPQVVVSDATLLPAITPFEVSDFVYRGGRIYPSSTFVTATPRLPPYEDEIQYSPIYFRAQSPNHKMLLLRGAAVSVMMQSLLRQGFNDTEASEYILDIYRNGTSVSLFTEQVDPLIGGVPMSELSNETLANSIFQTKEMEIRIPGAGALSCMSAEDWVMILGDNASSWAPVGCQGSAQCSMNGITIDRTRILRRTIPYMFSATTPSCDTFIPVKPAVEVATVRIGMAVTLADTTITSIISDVRLSPKDEVHTRIVGEAVLAVVTHPESVKRLIAEPAENLHVMNCFNNRNNISTVHTTTNPFLNISKYATLSVIENQRGVMILSNANSDFYLGSQCGSMNAGMGIWRQVANKFRTLQYNNIAGAVIPGPDKALNNRLWMYNVLGAFHMTGHACTGGGSCRTRTPCNLFSDELKWLRWKGVLPPRYTPFNPDAPKLNTGLKQFLNTSIERPSEPIINQIPNIQTRLTPPLPGCGGAGNVPMTLQGAFWQPERMNMWVGSNRMGVAADRIMYLQDTHLRQYRRISHGVSFSAIAEVPWSSVPHKQIFNDTATGCTYMPITTYISSPQLACVSANPKLAGTAAATIKFAANETSRELTIFVECVGFAMCPIWNTSAVILTDTDTGKPVPYNATTGSLFNPASAAGIELYVKEQLQNVVGSFNESQRFFQLQDYARYGVDLTQHISIKFNQSVPTARYTWEITGTPQVNIALADEYGAIYFSQLYQDGLAVAISPLHRFACLSLTKCRLKESIPTLCIPPPYNFAKNSTFGIVYNNTECECGSFEFSCQYDCGQNDYLYFIPAIVLFLSIVYLIVYEEQLTAKDAPVSPPPPAGALVSAQ